MRERKYRAWNKQQKRMAQVRELCTMRRLVYIGSPTDTDLYHPDWNSWTFDEIDLMDYIGHKDCNGVEIYESDLVSIEHTAMLIPAGTIGVVTYASGRYVVDTHAHTHGLNLFIDRRFRRYAKPYIEVVGNLYETPHLAPKK